jgi:hypothetical protein
MQKTTKSAVLTVALSLALQLTQSSHGSAQDQEEGAVELDGPGAPSEPAAAADSVAAPPASEASTEPVPSEERATSGANPGKLRFHVGPRIGVGGGFRAPDSKFIAAARVTPGFALGADYVLHRYFALGGETRFDWASLNDRDKFMLWSLLAKPRARHQLKHQPLEVYAALPVGLSVSNAARSNETGKVSAALGIAAGANYFFGDHWALNLELGWTWHWLRFDRSVPGNGPPQGINGVPASVTQSFKARFGQMALGVNLLYAL